MISTKTQKIKSKAIAIELRNEKLTKTSQIFIVKIRKRL